MRPPVLGSPLRPMWTLRCAVTISNRNRSQAVPRSSALRRSPEFTEASRNHASSGRHRRTDFQYAAHAFAIAGLFGSGSNAPPGKM